MKVLSILLSLVIHCKCAPTIGHIENDISKTKGKVLELKLTAVMDTITVVVHGQVVDLCNQKILPATIRLNGDNIAYHTIADSTGSFRFFHIQAGGYKLSSDFLGYNKLTDTTITFGTGDIWQLKIGLGCKK